MTLAGRPYAPRNPHAARLAGVAMIYQELNLAPDLSVEDNIMLGQERGRWGLLDRRTQRGLVHAALERLGHPDLRPEVPVRRLSVALRQLVEIARALTLQSKVLVFDEPTSSLTREDAAQLFRVIARLRETGIGVVYISHFLEEIRAVCDCFTVLRDGESVGSGDLADVSEAHIVSLMVGRSMGELFPRVPHEPGEVLLSLRELTGRQVPTAVTLDVRGGEILGIAGMIGAGRTELLRCLFGLDAVKRGSVTVANYQPPPTPRERIRAGMGLVSEDRKGEGLAQGLSIADNLTCSRLERYSRGGWLNLRARRLAVDDWLERLRVKARSQDQPVQDLSGGNQQRVALARVLHQEADVLLLDEPTRGIDVATKAEIYRLMGELAADGKAVVFVSSYLTELLAVCDRVAVMARGRLREVRPAARWTEEELMRAAIAGEGEAWLAV
jgi:ribose transport system ATP-binding protein